jgi:hypothetical protein
MWTAPQAGLIKLNAGVQLIQDTSAARQQYQHADGVRVAIQHNDTELWNTIIHSRRLHNKKTNCQFFASKQGRQALFQGSIKFQWRIRPGKLETGYYLLRKKIPSAVDANNKPLFQFNAKKDYVWTGSGVITAPISGTIKWKGNYHQPQLSDTVWKLSNKK